MGHMRRTTTLLNNMENLAKTIASRSGLYLCFVANVVDADSIAVYRFSEEIEDAFEAISLTGFSVAPDDVVLVTDIGRQPVVVGKVGNVGSDGGGGGGGTGGPVSVNFVIDGGGSAITTGVKGDVSIPFSGTITGVRLLSDVSGNLVVDLWSDAYGNYPPTVADSICASAKPTLSSATKYEDVILTGWDKVVSAGDIIRVNVDSATTVSRVTVALIIQPATSGGGGSGSFPPYPPNLNYTYTVYRTGTDTYMAIDRNLTILGPFSDAPGPPVVSGLNTVLKAGEADGVSWYFNGPRFEWPEDPTGDNDHYAPNGVHGLRFEGLSQTGTVLANWRDDSQAGYDTNKDTEPLSFTRCDDVIIRHMELVAGGNTDANNSSDTLDFDGCSHTVVEHVLLRRSRARAIVFDGGDTGAVSTRGRIHDVTIQGTPPPPKLAGGSAGTITVQEYRYCVTWVDSLFGETPAAEYTAYVPLTSTKKIRVNFETGPSYKNKGVTARKIYRWSAAQPTYRLVTTINDNTTLFYDDGATDASIASAALAPTTGLPTIPAEGVKLLGSQRHRVTESTIYGVNSHGIQIVRKGSDSSTNKNSSQHGIENNVIGYAGLGATVGSCSGIFAGGGDQNRIVGNHIANPGISSNLGYGIYLQNQSGATTDNTIVDDNTIIDTRNANHPAGAAGMLHGIRIFNVAGAAAPTDTCLGSNRITGSTGVAINDAGSNTHQFSETTHTHTGLGELTVAEPRFISGRWYGPRSDLPYSALSTQQLTLNHMYGSPFYATEDVTIIDIAYEITTLATVGTKLRIVIYRADETDGLWQTLLYESPDQSTVGTTGIKTISGINIAHLAQKRYWWCLVSDGDVTVRILQPTVSLLGYSSALATGKMNGLDKAMGTGWQSGSVGTGPASPSYTNNVVAIDGLV